MLMVSRRYGWGDSSFWIGRRNTIASDALISKESRSRTRANFTGLWKQAVTTVDGIKSTEVHYAARRWCERHMRSAARLVIRYRSQLHAHVRCPCSVGVVGEPNHPQVSVQAVWSVVGPPQYAPAPCKW